MYVYYDKLVTNFHYNFTFRYKTVVLLLFEILMTRAREFMHLHINLAKSYLMLGDIEIHFKELWLNM